MIGSSPRKSSRWVDQKQSKRLSISIGYDLALKLTYDNNNRFRLIPLLYGTLFIPVGYIIYGWAVEYHVYWVLPIFATMLMGVGTVLALVSLLCQGNRTLWFRTETEKECF